MDEQTDLLKNPEDQFPRGGGEMGALIREYDWSTGPLSATAQWPQSLKTLVRFMLDSRYSMWMGWGPALSFLYNDAYARDTLGRKHPWALGRRTDEVWAEIWPEIGPRIEHVLATGEATWDEGLRLFIDRHGFPEETYHTFSYSPVYDGEAIAGMFCVVTEETERVIGERRLAFLREVAAALTLARAPRDVFDAVARCVGAGTADVPFLLVFDGVSAGHDPAPSFVSGTVPGEWTDRAYWTNSESAEHVQSLEDDADRIPRGPWTRPPELAFVCPLPSPTPSRSAGVLVAGLNPHRRHNEAEAGFIRLLAGQISAALAGAYASEDERERSRQLAELDRVKTTFFSNVSHELRTPLTLMLAPLGDAAESVEPATPVGALLDVAQRNGRRLLKLVNSLLDFARIEAGRTTLQLQPANLSAVTANLASVFRAAMQRADLQYEVDCPPLAQTVGLDGDAWEKIVVNLIHNALKYTHTGRVSVSVRSVDGHAELRVKDTGVGIPADELPRIFERFHRVTATEGRSHEGTGIGLALVQELVKLHGGTIHAESVVGVGSIFTVRLPFASTELVDDRAGLADTGDTRGATTPAPYVRAILEEAAAWLPDDTQPEHVIEPIAWQSNGAALRSKGARVLIADDNADMRRYLSALLLPWWTVEAVADGQAALECARRVRPDLILCDVMMPRLDGLGLLQAIRDDQQLRDIPIILLSARAGEESRVEGMERGADDYLVKPFASRELLARVAAHLDLARTRREALRSVQENQARLEASVEAIRDPFASLDSAWRFVVVNEATVAWTGCARSELAKHSIWDVFPDRISTPFEQHLRSAAAASHPTTFEWSDDNDTWEHYAYPDGAGGIALLVVKVSDRKRQDAHRALLVTVSDLLARETDISTLMRDVGAAVCAPLQLSSCAFNEVDDRRGISTVPFGWFREDVPTLIGSAYRHADYVSESLLAANRRGEMSVVEDTWTDERTRVEAYRSISLRAFVTVPLLREGRWRFTFAVTDDRPRAWRPDEIELLQQVADRAFARLERALAERSVRDAEARIRLAGTSAQLGYWTWDLATRVTQLDDICRRLFGLGAQSGSAGGPTSSESSDAENGRLSTSAEAVLDCMHPEDRPDVERAVENAIAGISRYNVEFRVNLPDGQVRWLAGMGDVERDASGHPIRMAGVNLDITSRRAAEAALKKSEQRFRTMADTAPAMFWLTDTEHRLEFISRGWFEYTGQQEAAAYYQGFGWVDMVHEEDRESTRRAFLDAANRKASFELQYRLRTREGTYRWALDTGRPRFDDDGAWIGFIGTVIDVHERASALTALQEGDRRKDEFLATLAHELRNPLAPIRNALQILKTADDRHVSDRLHDMLDRQVGQLVRLVDELMEASRISRGQLQLQMQPVDLRDVLQQAVETSRPKIDLFGHRLHIGELPNAIPVIADAVRLAQVFTNLLNNAAKFSPSGGNITIEADRVGELVTVRVGDDGVGIPEHELESIFEMFAQGADSVARGSGGLGIGLALARRLVHRHGGNIVAVSDGPGRGSTFVVTLPLAEPSSRVRPTAHSLSTGFEAGDERVLVVDDNRDAADSLGMLIASRGVQVQVAHGGREALAVASNWHPDIVLLDLGMPELDGYSVARALRELPLVRPSTLVALTGWGQQRDRERTQASGFDVHLTKPITLEQLSRVFEAHRRSR